MEVFFINICAVPWVDYLSNLYSFKRKHLSVLRHVFLVLVSRNKKVGIVIHCLRYHIKLNFNLQSCCFEFESCPHAKIFGHHSETRLCPHRSKISYKQGIEDEKLCMTVYDPLNTFELDEMGLLL